MDRLIKVNKDFYYSQKLLLQIKKLKGRLIVFLKWLFRGYFRLGSRQATIESRQK